MIYGLISNHQSRFLVKLSLISLKMKQVPLAQLKGYLTRIECIRQSETAVEFLLVVRTAEIKKILKFQTRIHNLSHNNLQ